MFQHRFLKLPQIHSEDTDNGRFYVTPKGDRYQSVTTFLSKFSDTKWLDEWIERVGADQAAKTSSQAKRRGTAVHAILEQIVLNNPHFARSRMPNNLAMALSIKQLLDLHVDYIFGIEIGLWSDEMKIAGRADLLARWDEVPSIIDFKTAKYRKNEEDIQSYFLQCTLYAMMVEELFKVSVPQIVVIIGVDFEDAQVFIKPTSEYKKTIGEMVSLLQENPALAA